MELRNRVLVLASVCIVACNCASVKVTQFNSAARRPRTGDVDVYFTIASIDRPYKEIALITVDDEGWGMDIAKESLTLQKETNRLLASLANEKS
jgi:hypothetical protein